MVLSNPFRKRRHNLPRTYIDLIFPAENQYATWDPAKPVKVGDIGVILRETGEFDKLGNIYDQKYDKLRGQFVIEDPKDCPVPEGPRIICSFDTSCKTVAAEAIGNVQPVAEASFKAEVKFSSEKGAVLIMNNPLTTFIDCGRLVKRVLEQKEFKSKRVAIVTEITRCSQFAFLAHVRGGQSAAIQLTAVTPTPVPSVEAGGGFNFEWSEQTMQGQWKKSSPTHASNPNERPYTPLIKLRMLNPKRDDPAVGFRAPTQQNRDVAPLPECYPPWGELDTDGSEVDGSEGDDDDDDDDEDENQIGSEDILRA